MTFQEKIDYLLKLDQLDNDTYNNVPSFSYAASVNPNISTHKQAMAAHDADEFKESMSDELLSNTFQRRMVNPIKNR